MQRTLWIACLLSGLTLAPAAQWPMKQRDVANTGRADYTVPASRLNATFFDSLRWQKRTPNSPDEGNLGSSTMVFFDGSGPNGADLVVCGYHWPKGTQGMDRHTGAFFWAGNPDGGESIGNLSAAFSLDGRTVYVANDNSVHPQMAFSATVGPDVYWHNGGDTNATLLGAWSPKVAADGRIFTHGWCDEIGALTDDGSALHETWRAAASVSSCWNSPALLVETGGMLVVSGGRSGLVKAFDGATGAEVWSVDMGHGTDADATVDPLSGNIYLPVGFDSVYVVGLNRRGQPLWNAVAKPVHVYQSGQNNPQRVQGPGCLSHDGSTYYFQTVSQQGDGQLYAISTIDGSLKWSFDSHSGGWEDSWSSPVVTPNGVLVVGNNLGGTYYALRDIGSSAAVLDTLPTAGGMANSSATLAPDGVLYLPARLPWTQTNGDSEIPTRQTENLFNAFNLDGVAGTVLPAPTGLHGSALNRAVSLSWSPDTNSAFARYAVYRAAAPFTSIVGLTPVGSVTNQNQPAFTDQAVLNAYAYYYAVTTVSTSGDETNLVSSIGPLVPAAPQWPMRQRDAQNTGRADFTVPANRLNATFFNAIRWQKRAPGSPNDGGLNTSTMVFYDGVGPNGASLVVGGYHWPKGVQGMDRQTGKFFWAGNPDGGESIGANSAAFSPDGLTVYISNDNTPHPQMAFSAAFGPDVYWHNGADANATLLGAWSPKVAPDGRIFSHGWCSEIGALTDDGLALRQTWFADPSLDNCRNNPALLVDGPGMLVVSGGRSGLVKAFDGLTGAEVWSINAGVSTDGDATIDPQTGHIYLPLGVDSIFVTGLNKQGQPLWDQPVKLVYGYQSGQNNPQRVQSEGCLSQDGSTYYFQTVSEQGDGCLYAIHTADGSVAWSFNTHSQATEELCSSPVVTANGVLIVGNNHGGTYYALRDTGTAAEVLATLTVADGATASSSATLSPDGLLYLPARLAWVQSNGDNETPSQANENLFNAFDLNATPQITLPPPPNQRAHRSNGSVLLSWHAVADPGGQFSHYAIYRSSQPFTSLSGLTPIATISNRLTVQVSDFSVTNGGAYYYFIATVSLAGIFSDVVAAIGPIVPVDETDLQVVCIARTPRFPRYDPIYTYYEVTEPSGFGPYGFTAATGLGSGQTTNTPRWPALGAPVTYTATVRNRGTNPWTNSIPATWQWDGVTVSNPVVSGPLATGATTTFSLVRPWDGQAHEASFTLNCADARNDNNSLSIHTKSVPYLTYIDESFYDQFISASRAYTNAATDDLIDWLNRHMRRFNQMFADAQCEKRVHYDVLELLSDTAPDPAIAIPAFAIFPFRYHAGEGGDARLSGYYSATDDIDYGLLHEMGHQLGLIDLYQMDIWPDANLVSGLTYFPWDDLMRTVMPFLSPDSALAMNHWVDQAHGYYGQYLYGIPARVQLRLLDAAGQPLPNATVRMYQLCDRPGIGKLITPQVKAQGITGIDGIWELPNVPIDPAKVPPLPTGDILRDNPFGYVAVVGGNGVLHFEIESAGQTNYAWLGIVDANTAYYRGQTNLAVFERQWSASGVASAPMLLAPVAPILNQGLFHLQAIGGAPRVPIILETSPNLQQWQPVSTNTALSDTLELAVPAEAQPAQFYRARQ